MSIDKLRVGTRLVLGFGCVCVLLVASNVVGIIKTSTLNDGTAYIAGKEIPKIEQSGALLEQTDVIAIALRNMMLSADEQDRKAQLGVIAEARRVSDTQIQLLRQELTTEASKAGLLKAVEARDAYRAGQDELLGLIQAGKDDEAKAYLDQKLRPTLRSYKGALQNLIADIKHNVDLAVSAAGDTYQSSRNTMLGLGIFAVLLAAIIGTAITRGLLKQLGGEPDYAAQVAIRIAGGNLAVEVDLARHDESSMLAAMQRMRQELARIVSQVRAGTDAINTAAGEIAAGNQELSARTEQQASALEETASSLEELTSTVRQNADNARQANVYAQSASTVAEQGGAVVAQVVDRMSAINAASRSIVEIISVIDGIAFQTNILALNAAVEAARAGEQGRGFAVVASEVRTLAQRSAAAAKEIKGLIDNSVEQVAAGAALVDEAGTTMEQIIDGVRRVTDIMGEITAASDEQSAGIEQINQAVMQMDDVTQQNAALVEEAAAASAAMQEQAANLASTVAIFQVAHAAAVAPRPAHAAKVATRTPPRLDRQRRVADEFEAF